MRDTDVMTSERRRTRDGAMAWILAHFTRPTRMTRGGAVAVIVGLLVAVGFADFASGIRISLAVFYLVPILLTLSWFGTKEAAAAVLASVMLRVLGDVAANEWAPLPLWSVWNTVSTLCVFFFIVAVYGHLLSLARQLEQRVVDRTDALMTEVVYRRQLEHELLTISANERNSMGQELHDDICQHLVATALAAKVLTQRLEHENYLRAIEGQAIVRMIEGGVSKTRGLARGLLLSAIPPEDLDEKLTELAAEVDRGGLACRFVSAGTPLAPDADTAAQLYRIAQEATRNAIRHADAHRIDLSLVGDASALCLTIEDDGRGLDDDEPRSGMGLPIMSHRAAYIGATLSIAPGVGGGTKVICHLALGSSDRGVRA